MTDKQNEAKVMVGFRAPKALKSQVQDEAKRVHRTSSQFLQLLVSSALKDQEFLSRLGR